MKLFKINNCDDEGRPVSLLGIFQAKDKVAARQIASIHFKDPEIVTTGYYDAEETSERELLKEREVLKKLLLLTFPINSSLV